MTGFRNWKSILNGTKAVFKNGITITIACLVEYNMSFVRVAILIQNDCLCVHVSSHTTPICVYIGEIGPTHQLSLLHLNTAIYLSKNDSKSSKTGTPGLSFRVNICNVFSHPSFSKGHTYFCDGNEISSTLIL